MSRKQLFNDNWEFVKTPFGTDFAGLKDWEKDFQGVDIPHDWMIYDTQNLYETSTGWYRKRFTQVHSDNMRRFIRFEGVYMDTRVFVNGALAGEWKYGYSTFTFEITGLLKEGENTVCVSVDFQEPNSRWYSGAGIFRNVWLITAPAAYVVPDGIYLVTKKQGEDYLLEIEAEIAGEDAEKEAAIQGACALLCKDGSAVGDIGLKKGTPTAAIQKGNIVLKAAMPVTAPEVWDADTPVLYDLTVRLGNGDESTVRFGFRDFAFDPKLGFVANGKQVKLNGVCEHHDLGALGAAFNKEAMRRKFRSLKRMGVNAVRTSHNMPAEEFMELADEMGLYVDSEAFDMWERAMTPYDYARFFPEWSERDVASWIRRDRNHPSVIMWSIGNEIPDTNDERGLEVTKLLKGYVEEHDPKKNAMVTVGSNYMPWTSAQKCAEVYKLAGYNYADNHYDRHHEEYPDWIIYGSETSSIVQSRGVYHFPQSEGILTEEDEQCSSLGNSRPSWAAKTTEDCIRAHRDRSFVAGQFLWTGFDYIGEPTPYKTKNSYFGQIDTAGFPKDAFYMYQAEWTDYHKAPMVHVFPYWDFNPGQMIDVRVCSNAPAIELFVNGKSQGRTKIDHVSGTALFPTFRVPYEKGAIRAVAYDENGKVIAEQERRSFGDTARLVVRAEKESLRADGCDLLFVEISAEDAGGNPVENAMDYVKVTVAGEGRLLGLDNGDSTDYDAYKGSVRKLFNGKLLAIIGATKTAGKITIHAESASDEGIAPASLICEAVESPVIPGVSATERNREGGWITGRQGLVPVRKIELESLDGRCFDENKKEILVKATIYPKNATDRELQFSAVNDAGIRSNLAEVEVLSEEEKRAVCREAAAVCRIRVKGDGHFRLRAASQSGTDKVKLLSSLEFEAAGIGEAYINPYEFVAGALYNCHKGDVGGFSEKSVASAQEGISEIGYRGVDFGEIGSDEITLPIFAQTGQPHYLQIWEGMPEDEGSELLADVVYQKPAQWDVYQPETYKLKRRIKGITTLCFVTRDQRYFIKGFIFTRVQKAFEKLKAVSCNNIYGDGFEKTEQYVEKIGNNVSLEFSEMDFGEKGADTLTICGRTPLSKNTVTVRFFAENGEMTSQLADFPHCEEYTEVTFPIEKVTGMKKVVFVFLPGCDFDFDWFRFS